MSNIAEVAVPYAILALHDDKVEITEENISKILTAAGIEVEPIWISVFAKAFAGKDIGELLTNISAGAASAAPAAGVAAAAAPAAADAAPAKGKKEEVKKEESDEDMGFGLFD
jgi:large subunit ribosomal protein LP1